MSKQKIEVGQYWSNETAGMIAEVLSVSPAWIKVRDIQFEEGSMSVRRGEFAEYWQQCEVDHAPLSEVETPADPEVMPDYTPGEQDNMTLTMSNAIEAFNALTGHSVPVADGFLLLHAISVIVGRKDSGKCMDMVAMDVDFQALYEESR